MKTFIEIVLRNESVKFSFTSDQCNAGVIEGYTIDVIKQTNKQMNKGVSF